MTFTRHNYNQPTWSIAANDFFMLALRRIIKFAYSIKQNVQYLSILGFLLKW